MHVTVNLRLNFQQELHLFSRLGITRCEYDPAELYVMFFVLFFVICIVCNIHIKLWEASIHGRRPSWQPAII